LGERIVVRIPDRADRREHAMVVEDLAVVERGVLAAGVAVVDELDVGAGAAQVERHPQRVEDEIGAHVVGELPADDHPAVDVDHESEEDRPLPAAQVGEVGTPELVRPGGGEVALHQVGPPDRLRVSDSRAPWLPAPLRAPDAVAAHQPLHPAAADLLARAPQRPPHPPGAVGEVVARVDLPDQLEQPLVLDRTSRALAAAALVVGGRRHVQGLADRLDPEAPALSVDERAHLGRSRSSSLAKNTLAAFKISFARRSSKFSRRSLRISSRSSLVSRSLRRPSFASTCRTYFRSVSDGSPRSAATCAIGRPDSNTSRVARSNNSTGYFLALAITGASPSARTAPGSQVSVKPGMAQPASGVPEEAARRGGPSVGAAGAGRAERAPIR